jgi:hypothetical protein
LLAVNPPHLSINYTTLDVAHRPNASELGCQLFGEQFARPGVRWRKLHWSLMAGFGERIFRRPSKRYPNITGKPKTW